jgi:hypothetical protein
VNLKVDLSNGTDCAVSTGRCRLTEGVAEG